MFSFFSDEATLPPLSLKDFFYTPAITTAHPSYPPPAQIHGNSSFLHQNPTNREDHKILHRHKWETGHLSVLGTPRRSWGGVWKPKRKRHLRKEICFYHSEIKMLYKQFLVKTRYIYNSFLTNLILARMITLLEYKHFCGTHITRNYLCWWIINMHLPKVLLKKTFLRKRRGKKQVNKSSTSDLWKIG